MSRRALVLGAGGQLGAAMARGFAAGHEVASRTRGELDIADAARVRDTLRTVRPDVIVNCAAFTAVDAAETAPLAALTANAVAVKGLARLAGEIEATLVHFSTDFVFDGETDRPYVEADPPNPRGAYACSKLLGEWLAAETPRHYVLRVESLFGAARPRGSVDRLLDGIRAGTAVGAFIDRTVSPSYVEDVVGATVALVDWRAPCGVYHVVNTGWTTWFDLARELARLAGRPDAAITGIPLADAGLTVPRPRFAALSNAKLARAGIRMPTWQDALARYVKWRLGDVVTW
jgi:dTDP-4-dehydrorhamnose reductase